jgi:hypothetical protein
MAPWRLMSMNLRLHRKIMVVDGRIGFTGGMNLREGNLVAQNPRHPVRDLHFGWKARWWRNCRKPSPPIGCSSPSETLAAPDGFPRWSREAA